MAEESKDQKTEEASSKKIEDTEKKGNFTQSREVTSSFVLLASIVGFSMAGKNATETLMKTWYSILAEMGSTNLDVHELFSFMKWHMQNFLFIMVSLICFISYLGWFLKHSILPKFQLSSSTIFLGFVDYERSCIKCYFHRMTQV